MTYRLHLEGRVPSKKNKWRIRRRGRHGLGINPDPETFTMMERLLLQAQAQWKLGPPLCHPDITVFFGVSNRRPDRDNKLTTLLDILVAAGVLKNDSIAQCNGRIIVEPAIVVEKGQAEWTILLLHDRKEDATNETNPPAVDVLGSTRDRADRPIQKPSAA